MWRKSFFVALHPRCNNGVTELQGNGSATAMQYVDTWAESR